MENQNTEQIENQESQVEINSWEAAFAALDQTNKEDSEGASPTVGSNDNGSGDGAEESGGSEVSDNSQSSDSTGNEGDSGELGSDTGIDVEESRSAFASGDGFSEEDIEKYRTESEERIRNQAINDVAKEFIKRGVRNNNGALGATIDDSDVCKRDSDGVPRFYNPETGREFTGDNPRRQAQEWVDDYNKELARVFNNACEKYEEHLREQEKPKLAVIEFKPKYDKLDPIRKGMFDNLIENYEVTDNDGNVVGYNCDLDKALATVDRQIKMIQNYAKSHQPEQKQQPTGPALDMKTSSGAIPSGNDAPPSSLAEAMERLQDAQLAKIKN